MAPLPAARSTRQRLLGLFDPSGRHVRYGHDGHLLKSVVLYGGRTTTLAWDLHSRIQQITNWAGRSVTRDGSGNQTRVTDAQSNVLTYLWDPVGRLLG